MFVAAMQHNECLEFLAHQRLARLACARDDQPYVVPVFIVVHDEWLYGLSTVGQKIDWLRSNPRVCVQFDDIVDEEHWTSVLVFGRFQELTDTGSFDEARRLAHATLARHANWWKAAYRRLSDDEEKRSLDPIYFRIFVETTTGRRTSTSGA